MEFSNKQIMYKHHVAGNNDCAPPTWRTIGDEDKETESPGEEAEKKEKTEEGADLQQRD